MVKHSNNSSALPTTCLSLFDHFVGLALKGFTLKIFKVCLIILWTLDVIEFMLVYVGSEQVFPH